MKMHRTFSFFPFFLFFVSGVFGLNFNDLNLSGDNRLLFSAENQFSSDSQKTFFVSYLSRESAAQTAYPIHQLTAYPEKIESIENGRSILALNRFGVVKIAASGGLPQQIPGFPSFAAGSTPQKGSSRDYAASGDGRWILYIEQTSAAYGDLILLDTSGGGNVKLKVSEKVELPSSSAGFPACWNPDSRLFVYSKGGRLFYFPILRDLSVIADESYRQIGEGTVNSCLWGQYGDFYYLTGNILYRVLHPELFTRSIYGDFLSIGSVEAVFPFEFESGFDQFWVAPDLSAVLINKRGKNLFLFPLGENRQKSTHLPYIQIPQGAGKINVLWNMPEGSLTGRTAESSVFLTILTSVQKEMHIWRFEINKDSINTVMTDNIPLSYEGMLSPDGNRAVFWGENGLELWDYKNWEHIQKLSNEPVLSCIWLNNREVITGNRKTIERINITQPGYSRDLICLSGGGIEQFGYEESALVNANILARTEDEWYITDGINKWMPASKDALNNRDVRLRNAAFASGRFRVNLENTNASDSISAFYKNYPIIRDLEQLKTTSLVSKHSTGEVYAQKKMQVALVFDLYEDDTGVTEVLDILKRYNIKAAFFINGDFIRRNPQMTSIIAESGHETASLFYAPIDLSDARYRITSEFIVRGLARNEDEFFSVAGRELSLIWHPPYWRTSTLINSAASSIGYKTITRTIDPADWLSKEEAYRLNLHNNSASGIIDRVMEQLYGSAPNAGTAVIPVRLGLVPGGRDSYLFRRLDVLLDALIRSGCEVVPVSAVIR